MIREGISEREYRALRYNSSSSLKDFAVDRKKYYRKHILNESIKEEPNKAANMGRIVECLLMEPERFDDLFFMSSVVKTPGPNTNLGKFIWKLASIVGEEGESEGFDFQDAAKRAWDYAEYKTKFETVVGYLEKPDNRLFYEECLKVEHLGMTMVTVEDVENAERIVEALKESSSTSAIVNLETNDRFEVINQMKIEDYIIDGMRLKSMLDKVIIDHVDKVIYPYDLKCTWSVEGFYKDYYLYRRAYIQGYLYKAALEYVTKLPGNELEGYTVKPLAFIVCDSINYYQPLIYDMSEEDVKEAYEGFTHKYTTYPGVKQIIEECQWAIENDTWNISKTNFEKNGRLNIKD